MIIRSSSFVLLLAAGLPAISMAADQAGVSAGVRGEVVLAASEASTNVVGRQVKSGQEIFLGDKITSGHEAGMQIMLLDQTTFTIGADSEMTIDTFVYDPRTGSGKVSASIGKGVFRFVSGNIARNEPRNMDVKLPSATIGIRGTAVWGEAVPGGTSFVALAGPGPENNTTEKRGGIIVDANGSSQPISRPGFGALLAPGQPPQVLRVPPEIATRVLGALGRPLPPPAPATGGGGAPGTPGAISALAGQSIASALPALGDQQSIAEFSGSSDKTATQATQTAATLNGISTFEDLRSVSGGYGVYTQSNLPIGADGSYLYVLEIDFNSRSIGGGSSGMAILGGQTFDVNGGMGFAQQSFQNGSGPASFTFNSSPGDFVGSTCISTCNVKFTGTPLNAGGVIARDLAHAVEVRNTANAVVGTGSGVVTRVDLPPPPP